MPQGRQVSQVPQVLLVREQRQSWARLPVRRAAPRREQPKRPPGAVPAAQKPGRSWKAKPDLEKERLALAPPGWRPPQVPRPGPMGGQLEPQAGQRAQPARRSGRPT